MKRKLLAYMLLAMLLGTGSAVFVQPGLVEESSQAIESIQQLVANKAGSTLSIVKHSDAVNGILLLLTEAILLAGVIAITTKKHYSYQFHYTNASLHYTPEKEKTRRFSRDDVL